VTNKLYAHHQALYDEAEEQRKLCRDWLLDKMSGSAEKTQTKNNLRFEAIERFKISKSSFERVWTSAIEETGNHNWSKPLPPSCRKTTKKRLA
jgi:hypothetical protein